MPRWLWTLTLPLMAGGCSIVTQPDPRTGCGVYSVRSLTGPRLDPHGPIPACELPTAERIEVVCGYLAAGGTSDRPGYRLRGASCAFSNRSRSRASCTLDLVRDPPAAEAQSQRVQATFVHTYGEAYEPEASGFTTEWEAEGQCPMPSDATVIGTTPDP